MTNDQRASWLVNRIVGKSLLDVGCNEGMFAMIRQFGVLTVGVDINRWKTNYDYFVQADAHHLPFRTSSFDTVIIAEVLEHVEDPIHVLREAGRVAKERVLFSTPNEYLWSAEKKPFMSVEEAAGKENKTALEYFHQGTINNPKCLFGFEENEFLFHRHIRYWTREELTEVIKKAGLDGVIEDLIYDGWAYFVGTLKKRI